jgi:hypothetical protein
LPVQAPTKYELVINRREAAMTPNAKHAQLVHGCRRRATK